MVRSLPHPAAFEGIDAKRIAANSLVIVLHALALAVLLLPSRWSPPESRPAPERMVVVPIVVPPDPIPEPPTPPQPELRPTPRPPQPQPTARLAETPVADTTPVLDVGTEFALPVDAGPASDSFDPGPPQLATLAYDVHPAPRYPRAALRAGLAGTVTLRVLVDEQGWPKEVEVERSSGHRELDRAAREQVLAKWRFHPAQRQGRAIAAYALVPIAFGLP